MGFRDDGEAARARADAVERENRELRQRLAGLEQAGGSSATAAPTRAPGLGGRGVLLVAAGLGVAAMGGVVVVRFGAPLPLLLVCVTAGMLMMCMGVVSSLLYVASPNELLVLSGRPSRLSDGRVVGYRVIRGGRALRLPFLERVDRLDLTNIALAIGLQGVYSKGGARVSLGATANAKLAAEEPMLHNAVERFLGSSRSDIASVARETIEGAIRSVVAGLAVKELQSDREKVAQRIAVEAEHDLSKLGIELSTLQIERVEPEDQVP